MANDRITRVVGRSPPFTIDQAKRLIGVPLKNRSYDMVAHRERSVKTVGVVRDAWIDGLGNVMAEIEVESFDDLLAMATQDKVPVRVNGEFLEPVSDDVLRKSRERRE